jgi:uncharacterized protein (DUF1697 family)
MKTFIALLRGINLGNHYKMKMPTLKTMFENMGFETVSTYLQSGNVVFNTSDTDASSLETRIEAAILEEFGYVVPTLIRAHADLQRIIDANPFPNRTLENAINPYVIFLKNPPTTRTLELPESEPAEYVFGELEIFVHYPNGSGTSKLSNNLVERKLKTTASSRNWRTVLALLEMSKQT